MPIKTYRDSAIIAVAVALGALVLFGTHAALSTLLGYILGIGNLAILALLARAIIRGKGKLLAILSWAVKLAALVALLWLFLAYLRLNPAGILVGLTLPITAVIYRGFISTGGLSGNA